MWRPIVKCNTLRWAEQKRSNRSRCCLGEDSDWPKEPRVRRGSTSCTGRGTFKGVSVPLKYITVVGWLRIAWTLTLKQYNDVVRNKMDICIDEKEISDILRSSSPDFQCSAARILYAWRHYHDAARTPTGMQTSSEQAKGHSVQRRNCVWPSNATMALATLIWGSEVDRNCAIANSVCNFHMSANDTDEKNGGK